MPVKKLKYFFTFFTDYIAFYPLAVYRLKQRNHLQIFLIFNLFFYSSSSSPSKKTIHDDDEVDELIKLKSHVQELSEKVKYTSQQLVLAGIKEAEFTQIETQLKVEIADLKERSKKDLEAKESEFKIKIVQLEMEIQKQRDR